ncbi:Lipooligosaccharide biosynthesis galactosyltransferase [Tritrichomonas foetus]|uniref:Lipooligosaccharide biosynthesis galactosyltransferase n=1 Tax=Tritrichomonas foetus TaxID=1144522 RepID=A0A1J4K462_9EUKA|nr:Lipooligosaccharide biosynthesis galactosyltransferase [Tritrichomonas foetus]|eukprot:OHT04285.1 Lipooligosaccharide biosynthesis galactosyltransferase [Tritrichomonas foetus]
MKAILGFYNNYRDILSFVITNIFLVYYSVLFKNQQLTNKFIGSIFFSSNSSILLPFHNQKRNITLSVVIPIYNKRHFLNRSINTIIQNKSPFYEFVAVDDGSIDNSTDYVLDLMKKDDRICMVRNNYNRGILHTRYSGVKVSSGTYIMNFDADDSVDPFMIDVVLKKAFREDADVIEFGCTKVDANGTILNHNYVRCRESFTNQTILFQKLLNSEILFTVWKKIIKRDIYLKAFSIALPFIAGKKFIFAEDKLITAFVYIYTNKMICTREIVYHYYINSNDNSRSGIYQKIEQNRIQSKYVRAIYNFLKNYTGVYDRKLVKKFRRYKSNRKLFYKITSVIEGPPPFNCLDQPYGFIGFPDNETNFCLIRRAKYR